VFAVHHGHAGGLTGAGDREIHQVAHAGSLGRVHDVAPVANVTGRPGRMGGTGGDHGVGPLCGGRQARHVVEVRPHDIRAALPQPTGCR
jgi:hypothetical protein